MKLSQIAPMRWYHQVNLWTMNLSPWRYAALMASGAVTRVVPRTTPNGPFTHC